MITNIIIINVILNPTVPLTLSPIICWRTLYVTTQI